jgi:hypothetical protein
VALASLGGRWPKAVQLVATAALGAFVLLHVFAPPGA